VITREPVAIVEDERGSVTSGRYTVTVTRLRRDGDRWAWGWEIVGTVSPGHTRIVSSGDDMTTPWNYGGGTMLRTLAGFLASHAESEGRPGSDGADLFDHPCYVSSDVAEMIGDALGWDSWGED